MLYLYGIKLFSIFSHRLTGLLVLCIVYTGSKYINVIYSGGRDCMVVGFTTTVQTVSITTNTLSSNPTQAMCAR